MRASIAGVRHSWCLTPGSVAPGVLPAFGRRGIGTMLLCRLADEAAARGAETAGSIVDDDGSLAFARRFGFEETGRQVEQVYAVRGDETEPTADGLELVR